jgi:hypothetical protein
MARLRFRSSKHVHGYHQPAMACRGVARAPSLLPLAHNGLSRAFRATARTLSGMSSGSNAINSQAFITANVFADWTLRADTCAPTSVNDLSREKARCTETKFFPCRKTGGWNIGRALGERDDVTRQEFERESELSLKAAAYVSLTNGGAHNERNRECRRKRKTRLS